MPRKSVTVNSRRTSARPRMYDASPPFRRVFTGTTTPPAVCVPSAATAHSAMFGPHTPTRSPGRRPQRMSASAIVRTRSASSSNVSLRSPSTIASSAPKRCAASWTRAGIVAR